MRFSARLTFCKRVGQIKLVNIIPVPIITDHPRVPPAGHNFTDASGVSFRAKSAPELIKAVELYRSNNALHIGNPAQEIEAFYAIHFPWLISKVGDSPEPPKEEFLRDWINRLWRKPPQKEQWAESEKARERLQVCGRCPFNTPGGIISDVYLRRLIILGAGKISGAGSRCVAHKWDCGLAARIEAPETTGDPVPGCWVN